MVSLGSQSGRTLSLLVDELTSFYLAVCHHDLRARSRRTRHIEIQVAVIALAAAEPEQRVYSRVSSCPESHNWYDTQVYYVLSLWKHNFLTSTSVVRESRTFYLWFCCNLLLSRFINS